MRKHYLDNIRWIVGVLVVIYHVIYMYNGIATAGVIGPFREVQYQDGIQYLLYPWFMVILFIVSGISARCYLEKHEIGEFVREKTRKLFVPSTIGLVVFQWLQGYVNMAISNAFEMMPETIPWLAKHLIMAVSGTGVLWYLQMLWLFSMGLALLRKVEKGKLYALCGKVTPIILIALGLLVWAGAQVLNTPVVAVYRFGIYGVSYLLGYFVFAHEAVIERLAKYWHVLSVAAMLLGASYVWYYFGENYAVEPVINSPFSIAYGWVTILAVFAYAKKWLDSRNAFAAWMSKKSFGLYVFHYLPLSATAYVLDKYAEVPALLSYILVIVAAFAGGYALYEVISRIPVLRWCVLGIKKEKRNVS